MIRRAIFTVTFLAAAVANAKAPAHATVAAAAPAASPAVTPSTPAVAKATVTVKTVYDKRPGNTLEESVTLDGDKLNKTAEAAVGSHKIHLQSDFATSETHAEKKEVTSTINQAQPCGLFGTKICQVAVPVKKLVEMPVTTTTPVGSCQADIAFDAAAGMKVDVVYTFHDTASCETSCWKAFADGSKATCDGKTVLPAPAVALATPTPAPKAGKTASAATRKKHKSTN